MNSSDYIYLTPLLIIAGVPIVIMFVLSIARNYLVVFGFSVFALVFAFVSVLMIIPLAPHSLGVLFLFDGYGYFFMGLIIAASLLIAILSYNYNQTQSGKEEYLIILFIAALGAAVLVVANHFISFFIGLEILSVSLFILIAYRRSRDYSIEASVKYLVLASVSSAFLLFGMALVYASTGTMNFDGVSTALFASDTFPLIVMAGLGMIIVGVGFKLALVPFHMWTPDVYHGAPVPVTAFIASVSKAAVMAVLLRFFFTIKAFQNVPIFTVISLISILTMFIGNFLAIRENNLKRILAYSSISNLGYLLITLLTGSSEGVNSAIFYLISYVITTLGAFGIISLLSPDSHDTDRLESYRGLFWQQPWVAAVFTLTLLSLAGIPLTSGFMAKFYLFFAGLKSDLMALVISLVINSVIGLYYYLRIINKLFSAGGEEKLARVSISGHFVLGLIAVLILWLGLFPGWMIDAIAQYSILK
jgi:NADH-quinone oxidoreductase subunit N